MINFEKRFVHYFWIDTLEGKKGFVADTLADLRSYVQNKNKPRLVTLTHSENEDFEFTSDNINECYQFCYYDPNFEYKVAYEEGKTIQYFPIGGEFWVDCENEPTWDIYRKYRIKPIEEKKKDKHNYVVFNRYYCCFEITKNNKNKYILFEGTYEECRKWIQKHANMKKIVESFYNGKKLQIWDGLEWQDMDKLLLDNKYEYREKPTNDEYEIVIVYGIGLTIIQSTLNRNRQIVFKGTEKECEEWVKNNKDIQTAIKGYFSNKPIMYKEKGVKNDPWRPTKDVLYDWDFDRYEYRIATHEEFFKKLHSPKYVPFENTQELIEAWEKKYPTNKDRPNGTMPLIWIADKDDITHVSLITDFGDYGVSASLNIMTFNDLFTKYTFADGSICGKSKQEKEE